MSKPRARRGDIYGTIVDLIGTGSEYSDPPEPKPLRYVMRGRKLQRVESSAAEYQIITPNNDGFELWFGWNSRWNHHISEREVRALFWWLLWDWYAKARWFGLRRPVYYWALRRHLNLWRKRMARS